MSQVRMLGVYGDDIDLSRAATAIQTQRLGEAVAYAPAFVHSIQDTLQPRVSPVRLFTLLGGLLGCFLGFALPIYTILDWPLITGGKALISIPPLVVIAFALAMLLGALGAVTGFLYLSGLPAFARPVMYDRRFSEDRFGLLVTCSREQADAVRACLEQHGAEAVNEGAV